MTADVKDEVERLLRAGERPQAVRYLENTFKISSEDATKLIEALEREISAPSVSVLETMRESTTVTREDSIPKMDDQLKSEVVELIKNGRTAAAMQLLRRNLPVDLQQATVMIREVVREVNPNYVAGATGCLKLIAKGLGAFLMIVSILFIAAAAIIYFIQEQSISNSDQVTGTVTEMRSLETGESAPVIEYEWQGNKRSYESTFYSSPPDYQVGQSVSLFVNRDDPEDITLDVFVDRWALIVGLAVPGAFLGLISIVFMYFGRRKF